MTLLAVSLAATALGVLLDAGRLTTGGMVLSGCMVGTLVGDAMRHGRPRRTDVMTGAALLAVLGVLLLGTLAADGVVNMTGKGHDARYGTALGGRAAGEDTQVSIVGEVGRTAYAIHHLSATYLGAVHVAIEVTLDGSVERAHTYAGDDLGRVAYL